MKDEAPSRDDLLEELEADRLLNFDQGRMNNITDVCLSTASVVASLAATVIVSAGLKHLWIASAIAAVPAAVTSLQKIVDFRGRSIWYFDFAASILALEVSLRYAKSPNLEEFAKKRGDLEVQTEKQWHQIGQGSASGKRKAKTQIKR